MKKALVVGSGLVGCVIARELAEKGVKVEMWERRDHVGGNIFDYVDEHGIRVHKYGPHIFHTNNERVYDYMCKFGKWDAFELVCGAVMDGICVPTAFNFKSVDLFFEKRKAELIKEHIRDCYDDCDSATVIELLESDDELIREWAQLLYDKDYSLYTAKQWGISPEEIDKSVLKRVPIRFSYEEAYFADKYQVMPSDGYITVIENILAHDNISVHTGVDALEHIEIVETGEVVLDGEKIDYPVIYTGPIDELFKCKYGKLPYRSLRFEWRYEEKDSIQEMPVVAYPQAKDYTRITEYKKLPHQNVDGTTYAVEYPIPYNREDNDIEPYYPVLTEDSQKIYQRYRAEVDKIEKIYCCGRLADFKYYDMDKAIERALNFCNEIKL